MRTLNIQISDLKITKIQFTNEDPIRDGEHNNCLIIDLEVPTLERQKSLIDYLTKNHIDFDGPITLRDSATKEDIDSDKRFTIYIYTDDIDTLQ